MAPTSISGVARAAWAASVARLLIAKYVAAAASVSTPSVIAVLVTTSSIVS